MDDRPIPPPGVTRPAAAPARSTPIDFWRGFVLCTIFVNHVPGTVFEKLTFRNFGFSDSAEAFVFISGLSLALAYGRRFRQGRQSAAIRALGRRAVTLYATHIALSVAGLFVFATGAAVFVDAGLMDVHGRDLAVTDPLGALTGVVMLGHQFGYFNILPLYVVLVAAVPALLWLSRAGRPLMLAVSFGLYVAARVWDVNIPTWPMQGEWFLDPFAWQLLLAIGLAVGLRRDADVRAPNRLWLALSATVVVIAMIFGTDGFGLRPGLYDVARQWGDLDKTMLGTGRLIHFLALAYLVHALGVAPRMSQTPIYRPLCMIGRHGLAVFAILSVLAAIGQVVTAGFPHSIVLDTAIVGGGLALLYAAAIALDSPARLRAAIPAAALHTR